MKLGVCSTLYRFLPLEQAMDHVVAAGLNVIELACGGYPGCGLCNPAELLADDAKLKKFLKVFDDRDIEINALAAHGNPLHPQAEIREQHQADFRNAILLAEKIGVDKVINFSGCPGDSEEAKHPNWCVIPWPSDYTEVLAWQWENKVIPYWQEMAQFAADHHVNRVAIELHPGFVVYNVRTMLRLREAAGPVIGANMDPSHLFWQSVDPVRAILALGKAIFHVHLKDTAFNPELNPVHGVLDPTSVRDIPNRCWIFRTVGYGHDALFWKQFISALQQVGYEDAVCIEHEDRLIGGHEGLQKSLAFLKDLVIKQHGGQDWWLLPDQGSPAGG